VGRRSRVTSDATSRLGLPGQMAIEEPAALERHTTRHALLTNSLRICQWQPDISYVGLASATIERRTAL